MPSPPLTVVVVSYNTADSLRRCLASLRDEVGSTILEAVVVDNASKDGSVEMVRTEFPWVRLIVNTRNIGFGAANNQALRGLSTPFALLLNSDAVARAGAVEQLLRAVDSDPEVVAAGGRLVDTGTERTQNSCANRLTLWAVFCEQTLLEKLAPQSPWLAPYWVTKRLLAQRGPGPFEVEQVQGACLLMRPKELFDESFFLYVEDTELCHRLRGHGRILYVPSAVFDHELGASSSANRWWSVAMYNHGKERYFGLHHGPLAALACWLLNRAGALLRLAAYLVGYLATLGTKRRLLAQASLFLKVLTAPWSGPARPDDA